MDAAPAEATHFSGFGKARVYGRSYARWSAAWWGWARSFPVAQTPSEPQNPVLEGDPANFLPVDCSRGQRGLVWFLAGTPGGVLQRSCTIPRGRALFFPLVNGVFFNAYTGATCSADAECGAGNACDDGRCRENASVDDKRGALAGLFDAACEPIAILDGRPLVFDQVATVRAQSAPFSSEAGPNDLLGGSDGDRDPEAISDGVWAMLPPLSSGVHDLRFGGGVCFGGQPVFSNEAIYQITVP